MFSSGPPGAYYKMPDPEDQTLREGWSGKVPAPRTLALLPSVVGTSAFACAAVKTAAGERGVVLSEEEGRARLKAIGLNTRTTHLYGLSLPAVSGSEALAIEGASSNQLASHLRLVLLEKTATGWKVVSQKMMVVG